MPIQQITPGRGMIGSGGLKERIKNRPAGGWYPRAGAGDVPPPSAGTGLDTPVNDVVPGRETRRPDIVPPANDGGGPPPPGGGGGGTAGTGGVGTVGGGGGNTGGPPPGAAGMPQSPQQNPFARQMQMAGANYGYMPGMSAGLGMMGGNMGRFSPNTFMQNMPNPFMQNPMFSPANFGGGNSYGGGMNGGGGGYGGMDPYAIFRRIIGDNIVNGKKIETAL